MSYKVKLDVFEGPFDLLVYLIESAEMSIYDIPIAELTAQYLEHVEALQKADPALSGEFMLLAATLIDIKAKMLLPRVRPESGGEGEEDPRSPLVERILEYKKFKAAAGMLETREAEARRVFTKPAEDLAEYTKETDYYLSLDIRAFVKAFEEFLLRKRRVEEVHRHYDRAERQRMSLESRIGQLKELFARRRQLSFEDLLEGNYSREQCVLTFLSVLELIRERAVEVRQLVSFGEIVLCMRENNEEETPIE